MKRKIITIGLFVSSILFFLTFVSCTEAMNGDGSRDDLVTITLKMSDGLGTRAYIDRDDKGLVTGVYWNENEMVKLYALQDGVIYILGEWPVVAIPNESKKANIEFRLPGQVDKSKPCQLFGISHAFETKIAKDESGNPFLTGTFSYKERYEWTGNAKRDKVPWCFETTFGHATNVEVKQLAAYEFIHIKNTASSRSQIYLKKIEADECWFYNTFHVQFPGTIITGEDESFIEDEFRYSINTDETIGCYTFYLPNGKKPRNVKFHFTVNNQEVVMPARNPNIEILPGHAYHYWLTWDGQQLTFDNGDVVEEELVNEIGLETTSVEIEVDGSYAISHDRAKFFDIESSNSEVATAELNVSDDWDWEIYSIGISAHSIGTAIITLTDRETGKRGQVKVTVVERTNYDIYPEIESTQSYTLGRQNSVLEAYSEDSSIASCTVKDNTVAITGHKIGFTIIHVTDKTTAKEYTFNVRVVQKRFDGESDELDDVPGYEL